jgi:DNA-binding PadR family transcriptional regulator
MSNHRNDRLLRPLAPLALLRAAIYRVAMQGDTTRTAARDPGLLILASLAAGPRHGYAMVEDIAQFGGARLGPGTLYGAIARLEEAGLIEALEADDRRRPYRLTAAGMRALATEIDALELVVSTVRDRLSEAAP